MGLARGKRDRKEGALTASLSGLREELEPRHWRGDDESLSEPALRSMRETCAVKHARDMPMTSGHSPAHMGEWGRRSGAYTMSHAEPFLVQIDRLPDPLEVAV